MLEKLDRAPMEEVRIGGQFNAAEIQSIILEQRWPRAKCKTCGNTHDASIRKVCESEQGGEFQFCEPECPNASSSREQEFKE